MDFDVVVIGAGPGGAAAAAALEQRGLTVCVLEKSTFPRFVIGESLLPHCLDRLQDVGLLEVVQAAGFLQKVGADFLRGDQLARYDFDDKHGDGWDYAWQVPRAEFDDLIIRTVAERGVDVRFRTEVLAVDLEPTPTVRARDENGNEITIAARFIVDASGYGRVLPRLFDLDAPSGQPVRQSMFTWVRGDRRERVEGGLDDGRTWICLHPNGSWVWVIPFADGKTSVGVVGDPATFEGYPESPTERMAAILAEEPNCARRLANAEYEFEPRTVRGFSTTVKKTYGKNFCLVGNATEFLDPVFSSGVTLAFESGVRAANLIADELSGETVDWEEDFAKAMAVGIDVFRTFVDGWYDGRVEKIFFAPRQDPKARREVCAILGGYVWDRTNPTVKQHTRRLNTLVKLVDGMTPPIV